MGKPLFVSYSSMNAFRKCPRFYYWKHIRRLEKRTFKLPFIVGRIMHHGIQTLLSAPEKATKAIQKKYKEEAQVARKEFQLSQFKRMIWRRKNIQQLACWKHIGRSMQSSYKTRHMCIQNSHFDMSSTSL